MMVNVTLKNEFCTKYLEPINILSFQYVILNNRCGYHKFRKFKNYPK